MSHIPLPHDHGVNSAHLMEHMPHMEVFSTVSEAFKLLSDPNRARVYWLLCHCEECVANLSAMMGMSSPAISHHLRQLREAGLITSRREGKEVYYRSVQTPEARILHDAMEHIMAITCPMEKRE